MSHLSFSKNNFDLIRLFAASQVAIHHSAEMLVPQFTQSWPIKLLGSFPGVPIFFFISGFLISRSYERSPSMKSYANNRALRIYPALQVCLILNILAVLLTGYFQDVSASFGDVLMLYLAKGTILQFYNPDFMRRFGDGVLNGSLWTICVELQFYLLVPVIYRLLRKNKPTNNITLLVLVAGLLICNRLLYSLENAYSASMYWKLFRVSFLPWFYIFLMGVLIQRNFHIVERWIRPINFPIALGVYAGYALAMQAIGLRVDNGISPLLVLPLLSLVLIAAYSKPHLADSILHKQDISYGIYIYHMPVVNMALYIGYTQDALTLTFVLILSLLLACASWLLVERPSLMKKNRSSHPIAETSKVV